MTKGSGTKKYSCFAASSMGSNTGSDTTTNAAAALPHSPGFGVQLDKRCAASRLAVLQLHKSMGKPVLPASPALWAQQRVALS